MENNCSKTSIKPKRQIIFSIFFFLKITKKKNINKTYYNTIHTNVQEHYIKDFFSTIFVAFNVIPFN